MDSNDPQNQQAQQGSGTAIQVMPTVLGTSGGGQQIYLQPLQQTINAAGGQQQIQVVPIQTIGQGNGQQMLIVQPQVQQIQPQIVQLPDGQTFLYQPMIPDTTQQPQIVNINGNFFQIPAQQSPATANIQTSPPTTTQNQPTQQVVMMATPSATNLQASAKPETVQSAPLPNIITTTTTTEVPSTSTASPVQNESEEEPLYVNASKYQRFFITCFLKINLSTCRTIQKDTKEASSASEAGSTGKNSERTTKISVRITASTRDE